MQSFYSAWRPPTSSCRQVSPRIPTVENPLLASLIYTFYDYLEGKIYMPLRSRYKLTQFFKMFEVWLRKNSIKKIMFLIDFSQKSYNISLTYNWIFGVKNLFVKEVSLLEESRFPSFLCTFQVTVPCSDYFISLNQASVKFLYVLSFTLFSSRHWKYKVRSFLPRCYFLETGTFFSVL